MKSFSYIKISIFISFLHISFAQNVGIGTATPGSKLSVYGNISVGTGYAGISAPANGAIIQGNVGIGTTVPAQKLHVQGGTARISALASGPYRAIVTSNIFGDLSITHFTGNANHVLLGNNTWGTIGPGGITSICASALTNYVQKWTGSQLCNSIIYDNGINVGIGTTAPLDKLDIRGTRSLVHISGNTYTIDGWGKYVAVGEIARGGTYPTFIPSSSVGIESTWESDGIFVGLVDRSGSNAKDAVIGWGDDHDDRLMIRFNNNNLVTILPSGYVGIGTTTPSVKLEVCGDAKVVGQVTAKSVFVTAGVTCASDIRYKTNITPLTDVLNKIMQLRGVNYFWKTDEFPEKHFSEGKQIGFIAQELEKIYPELVYTDQDGYKWVDYSRLTPILVEAIKEQQKIIQKQLELIKQLQEKNRELESKVKEIEELKVEIKEIKSLLNLNAEK